ncbi:hypothetical protein EV401DRAFT_2057686 [Pisolithus croceorrhizus]|nr:hypothetical protein EV401DRAFT_2057686 [Pisolithus croceorrhizus]
MTAQAIVDYLAIPDVQQHFNLLKTVSLATAQHWMEHTSYSWTTPHNGQYVDGHEQEDVVEYWQNKFLPAWYALDSKTWKWSATDTNQLEEGQVLHSRPTKPTLQPKGEGLSLMVADFMSADYGWLQSPDGKESACVLFCAGKAWDGYFSNDAVICQVETAMTILEKDFPHEDHVFIFDNARTHLKHAGDALCAHNMPHGCIDWGITVPKRDSDGTYLHDANGKLATEKIHITDGFHNGISQAFYWPDGHPNAGLFKGMAQILTKHGYDVKGLKAQCRNFKCPPNSTNCCCHCLLFSQPDFTDWLYHFYPPLSKDCDLEQNVIQVLDSVPLMSMRKFAIRSHHFMDAYHKGLNGQQAAWATRKYHSHRILPVSIMNELKDAQIL